MKSLEKVWSARNEKSRKMLIKFVYVNYEVSSLEKLKAYLVRVFKYIFCLAIHKMVGPTVEFIVWLIFSK